MNIRRSPLEGVVVVESAPRVDARGTFARLFCGEMLGDVLGNRKIVQINHSLTRTAGTVRGMHYQRAPHAEMKLVRCLRGRVWDVAVDLRAGSPTLLQWHAEELAAGDGRMIVIPEGCAHGFQALDDDSELLYLHTALYVPGAEAGVHPQDPRVDVRWPLAVAGLSERDRSHPLLDDGFTGV